MISCTAARGQRAGFTLLEVVIAFTLLALLTGSIYSLMRAALRSGAELELAEREDRAVYRLLDLCRDMFLTLPAEATILCPAPEDDGRGQELTVTQAPEAFRVGEPVISGESLSIGLRPDSLPSGDAVAVPLSFVAVSRPEFAPREDDQNGATPVRSGGEDPFYAPDEEGRYWLPLLRAVERFEWRFWNAAEQIWETEWTDETTRPPLVELTVLPYGRGLPYRMVYTVPSEAAAEDLSLPDVDNGAAPGAGGGVGRLPRNGGQGTDGGRGPEGGGRGPDGGGRGPDGGGRGPDGGGPGRQPGAPGQRPGAEPGRPVTGPSAPPPTTPRPGQ